MGVCPSKPDDKEADDQNRKLNKYLEEEKKKQRDHVKLLLLGAGESGKSTIAKQMKIIHLNGFSEAERVDYKSIIFSNVVGSIRVLVEAADHFREGPDFQFQFVDMDAAKRVLQEDYFNGEMNPQIARDVKTLWNEKIIKETFARSNQFQLNDSAEYYFDEIDRLSSENYIPTTQDVLRSRAKTTGIIETEFTVEKIRFTLVDVGGQRSERRKWMHCFQDVTAVIFCVALSGYDLKLYEDETTNRMHEALKLFKDICNTKWFADTAIILFLNKKDIFQNKIAKVPLKVCFSMYAGANTYEEAIKYIEDQFVLQNENPRKLIYTHKTCATDTENIMVVFKAVQDIILHHILEKLGM